MRVSWLLLVFLSCLALRRQAHAEELPPLAIGETARYRLDNGLEVILQQDRRQPRVAVVMAYDVGHRDEPRGYAGIAHLIEHLTYRGSRHMAPFAAMTLLERAGATEVNAGVGDDRTYYYAVVPASRLELTLWIESDRMAFVLEKLNQRDLAVERAVVLNELRERRTPTRLFQEQIARALYPLDHPYAPALAEAADVAATELAHVQWFFQQTYRPDSAILTLVGDFDLRAARQLVARYFAAIGKPPGRHRRPAAAPLAFSSKERVVIDAPYSRGRLAMVWPIPGPEHRDAPAVDLLAQALGEGALSHLHARTVDGVGAATAIAADVEHLDLVSWMSIGAELAHNRSHQELERIIDGVLLAVRATPPSERELVALKRGAVTRVVLAHEQLLTRALLLTVSARSPGRKLYDPNRAIARLQAITAAAVQAAAKRYLRLDRRLVAWMRAASGAPLDGAVSYRQGRLYP
jgi:zinc protease